MTTMSGRKTKMLRPLSGGLTKAASLCERRSNACDGCCGLSSPISALSSRWLFDHADMDARVSCAQSMIRRLIERSALGYCPFRLLVQIDQEAFAGNPIAEN